MALNKLGWSRLVCCGRYSSKRKAGGVVGPPKHESGPYKTNHLPQQPTNNCIGNISHALEQSKQVGEVTHPVAELPTAVQQAWKIESAQSGLGQRACTTIPFLATVVHVSNSTFKIYKGAYIFWLVEFNFCLMMLVSLFRRSTRLPKTTSNKA